MESLEHLRKKLDSLDDLRSIVKTMKALSAASIRQYEQAAHSLAGYSRTVSRALQVVLKDAQQPPESGDDRDSRPVAAIVFGSDHGLCGRFNEEIAEHVLGRLDAWSVQRERRELLAVGARVASQLQHSEQPLSDTLFVPSSAAQITGTVQRLLLRIDAWTEHADLGRVHLFYNQRSQGQSYEPTSLRLLPIDLAVIRGKQEQGWPSRSLPTFTMERKALLSHALRQYLFVSLFRACAESLASEHASRLAAMQSAERNLDERIGDVTTLFRRARQTAITSELLDVVSGFEATTRD